MDWVDAFGSVNYWAVLVAAIASFPVGFAWFARSTLGLPWARMAGVPEENLGNPNPIVFVGVFIGSFVAAHLMAALMGVLDITSAGGGALLGVILGIAIRLPSHLLHDESANVRPGHFLHDGFEARPFGLTLINGGHDIVQLSVMGLVLGLF